MELPLADVPEPDASLEPAGFMVTSGDGERIHFLDWGAPGGAGGPSPVTGVVAVHGIGGTAWVWAPVARRLAGPGGRAHVVAMDLRGHGLSDAPTETGAYDLARHAGDVIAVAEGAGILTGAADRVVLAGHGFGAIAAAHAAAVLGRRCAGLVLVDGGWEDLETTTGVDVDEFLRGIDEPPEVMRSMAAYLKDRRNFDPATWDPDQERVARSAVVETHAGKVVPSARPHATEATVRTMFEYAPLAVLPDIEAPIVALRAADDETGTRAAALDDASAARRSTGREPIATIAFEGVGHNMMRYRPREVAAAILSVAEGA
jgi:pimeloyl-ACP methyl ester carboxylesterase